MQKSTTIINRSSDVRNHNSIIYEKKEKAERIVSGQCIEPKAVGDARGRVGSLKSIGVSRRETRYCGTNEKTNEVNSTKCASLLKNKSKDTGSRGVSNLEDAVDY